MKIAYENLVNFQSEVNPFYLRVRLVSEANIG